MPYKTRSLTRTLLFASLVLFSACGGRENSNREALTAAKEAGPLRVILRLDQQTYEEGAPAAMTLTAGNTSDRAVEATFSSGQMYDFIVQRNGEAVWRWSSGRFFTQAIVNRTIAAGETLRFTEVWDQRNNDGEPVPPGEYEAIGVLTAMERVTTPPVKFSTGE